MPKRPPDHLSETQRRLLAALLERDGRAVAELVPIVRRTRDAVRRLLYQLRGRGLVELRHDQWNRSLVSVWLTPEGRATAEGRADA